MRTITSRDNDAVKAACRLRDDERERQARGLFFAEGPKLCLELAGIVAPQALFATRAALERTPAFAAWAERTVEVAPHVAQKLAGTAASQQVFGLFPLPPAQPEALYSARRLLALENVQDPGNVGTLLRSAAAFGFDAVLLSPGCAAPFAPKTLRASMGAAVRLPILPVPDLPAALRALRGRGTTCLAAALRDARPLQGLPRAWAQGLCLVVGSEGRGLSGETIDACDAAVRIPMTDRVESLNAGVAGSILLWHFRALEGQEDRDGQDG